MKETPASPKILLSGASGMLGSAVRQALAARSAEVLTLVRGEARGAGQLNANQLKWNPAAGPAIADTAPLEGLDAAIHLSGANVAAHRWTAAYQREIWTSRVESTRVLSETLAGLERRPHVLVVASATGIYGNRGDEVLDESSAPGSGFLADLCRAWEAAARPAVEAGIRVVHTRFSVVLGRSGALAKMLPLFRLGLGGRLGSGRQWMSWVSLADVAAAILFALDTPQLAGAVNVTAPHPVTNQEFTLALARAVHRPAIVPAPAFALRLALGKMADETLLASARVVPARLESLGFRFTHERVEEAIAAAIAAGR